MSSEEMRLRNKVTEEISSTEETYVNGLETLAEFFGDPRVSEILNDKIPGYNRYFAPILALNKNLLEAMQKLKKENPDAPDSVIVEKAILERAQLLKMYNSYLANYDQMSSKFTKLLKKNKKFQKLHQDFFQHKNPPDIGSYLVMPVQRAPRYKLLLTELQKRVTPDSPRHQNIAEALSQVEKVTKGANEAIRAQENAEVFYQFFKKLSNNDPIRQFIIKFEENKGPLGNDLKQYLMYLNSNRETQTLLRGYLNSKPFLDKLNNPKIKSGDFQKNMLENLKEIKVTQLLKQLNTNEDWSKLKKTVDNIEDLKNPAHLNADAKARLLGKLGEIKITQLLQKLDTQNDWKRLESVLNDIKALRNTQEIVISEDYIKRAEEKIRYKTSEIIISNLRSVIEIIQKDPKLQKKLGLDPGEIKKLQDHAFALGYQSNNPQALAAKNGSLKEVLTACNLANLEIQGKLTKIKEKIAKKQQPSVFKKVFINLANLLGFQKGIQEKYKQQEVPKQYEKPLEQYEQLRQYYANILKAINTLPPLHAQAQKAKPLMKGPNQTTAKERPLATKDNRDNTFLPTATKKVQVHPDKHSVPLQPPPFLSQVQSNPKKGTQ